MYNNLKMFYIPADSEHEHQRTAGQSCHCSRQQRGDEEGEKYHCLGLLISTVNVIHEVIYFLV